MATKAWGSIGDWAADVEAEEKERQLAGNNNNNNNNSNEDQSSFPSLKEAATAKPKKKQQQKMSLSEFNTGVYVGPGGGGGGGGGGRNQASETRGLTPDEWARLPTGPRERSAEEMEYGGRLGGGFRNYGGGRMDGGGRRDRDEGDGGNRWGGGGGRSFGGFADERDRERRPPMSRVSEFEPSRADEVDNWASMKKSGPPPAESGRERYGALGSGSSSRADDVDNWSSSKKPVPSRSSSFGTGFRDSAPPISDRRRLVLDPPSREPAVIDAAPKSRLSPFGAARPREEILAEKGLDWRKVDTEIEAKKAMSEHSSRPSSAHSSCPESPVVLMQTEQAVAPKPRPKVNPFGDAKPREVLLQEQGKDWRKMDFELEHKAVDRPETAEEKQLKDEILQLKEMLGGEADEVKANGDAERESSEQPSIPELIAMKEKDLELLIRDLDDKLRFGQKSFDRPGSGSSSKGGSFMERPPSHSGIPEDLRNVEFTDRPRSRGSALPPDVWTRGGDERRSFQGSRDRGFLGNRDSDRFRSKERW